MVSSGLHFLMMDALSHPTHTLNKHPHFSPSIYSHQSHSQPSWNPKKEVEFCFSLHLLDISYIVFNAPSNSSRLGEEHMVMRAKKPCQWPGYEVVGNWRWHVNSEVQKLTPWINIKGSFAYKGHKPFQISSHTYEKVIYSLLLFSLCQLWCLEIMQSLNVVFCIANIFIRLLLGVRGASWEGLRFSTWACRYLMGN